ncbi:MAG: ThuA domain-containing protein [Flavobacteriales bacterium]|nr:ThuA domain-containing protein [Flavobacteriales bacterium]
MKFNASTILFLVFAQFSWSQTKVLHYSETSGYDHNTRTESLAMFETMGTMHGFMVDNDDTGDGFNSLSNLHEYDAVIFSNTSGDAILDASQRANFETYIANGGSYLGIHAATDTYRHSTANGNNTGTWDFYAELVGASVQESPNHVYGTPQYSMSHIGVHASLENLPSPWVKNEEYYYWENGYFGNDNTSVLQVEETVGPNNMVNSYDAARPMSWYRSLAGGGKMFYTALGHAASNYSTDQDFIYHVTDALLWVLGIPVGISSSADGINQLVVSHRDGVIRIESGTHSSIGELQLYNALGQKLRSAPIHLGMHTHYLPAGWYVVNVVTDHEKSTIPIILNR